MDYSVRDSSILQDPHGFRVFDEKDCAVRIGIVRSESLDVNDNTRYVVEVASGGRQIPVSCTLLTRWGGAFNYEEYRVRPWVGKFPANFMSPSSAGKHELRSGDVVLVAYMEGQSREGVILGGLTHPSRSEKTVPGKIEYISNFNGIETQIRSNGSYKVTFQGAPVNEAELLLPPTGIPIPDPIYNPLVSGSFYGFDSDGSYIVSDGDQFIKLIKKVTGGNMVIVSGNNRIDLGGNKILSSMGLESDSFAMDITKDISLKSNVSIAAETLQLSLKAAQIAIGNDAIELVDGIIQLIDGLGSLVVMSPVGTCTPLMAAPTWPSLVLPLKIKLSTLKTSVKSAGSVSESDEGDTTLGSDVGS